MPVHPDVAARFPLLDGLPSMREAYGTPAGLARIREYESWDAAPPPHVATWETTAPGPHGPVPVRVYEPPAGDGGPEPCLVWLHGGGFLGGDLDMREADWTARDDCDSSRRARAGFCPSSFCERARSR